MFNHPLIQSGKVIPSPGVDMPSSSVLINQYINDLELKIIESENKLMNMVDILFWFGCRKEYILATNGHQTTVMVKSGTCPDFKYFNRKKDDLYSNIVDAYNWCVANEKEKIKMAKDIQKLEETIRLKKNEYAALGGSRF